jgi:hypothetical protein
LGIFTQQYSVSGNDNISMGYVSLRNVYSGNANVALGTYSLNAATSGCENVAVGPYSLTGITSGNYNVGLGSRAGNGFSTGNNNVAIGYNIGNDYASLSSCNNTFIAGAGAERFRIDGFGNMGIATTTPNVRLTVNGAISSNSYIYGDATNLTGLPSSTQFPYTSGSAVTNIVPVKGSNLVSGTLSGYSNVGGGTLNIISGNCSTITGGYSSCISSDFSSINGGNINCISGNYSNIAGGRYNLVSGSVSNIAGGCNNTVTGNYSNIDGGNKNIACGDFAVVSGGSINRALSAYSMVAGGYCNTALSGSFVGGGYCNTASGEYSTIVGGFKNNANGGCSFIGGGRCNNANNGVIIGGINNSSTNSASVIVGGCCNVSSGSAFTFVAGGSGNHNKGNINVVLLGSNLSASQANFTYVNNLSSQGAVCGTFYGDATNLTGLPSSTQFPYTSSSSVNNIKPVNGLNTSSGAYSIILGGSSNKALSSYDTILNGKCNTASGYYSTIVNGLCNNITIANANYLPNNYSFIGSGSGNCIYSTGPGGQYNGYNATILNGFNNCIQKAGSYGDVINVSILNGCSNCIVGTGSNLNDCIMSSYIGNGCNNVIIADNAYANINNSSILNGCYNKICSCNGILSPWYTVINSTIVGGANNLLYNTCNSFIAGGTFNYIPPATTNIFILGSNLSASQANFTYVNNISSQGVVVAPIIAGGTQLTTISDLTYTFQLSDNGGTIAATSTTGLTASVIGTSYPIGFQVGVLQLNTGRVSVSGQNITINQSNGFYRTTKQYSAATLLYTGTTGWVLFGDLAS